MSLGVVIKGPEGVILAADSRITLQAQRQTGPPLAVNFDNASKLLAFSKPHNFVGAVTYGAAAIGRRTARSFTPEFELGLGNHQRLAVQEFAKRLSGFFMERWQEAVTQGMIPADYSGPGMAFVVGGYDADAAYGKVFLFEVPNQPEPEPRNPGDNEFGMTWGGQLQIGSRLVNGYDPELMSVLRETLSLDDEQLKQITQSLRSRLEFQIPYDVLPLQDCVDLATFLIRSTVTPQGLAVGLRGVGGPIDVAVITRTDPIKYVQQKQLRGEDRT